MLYAMVTGTVPFKGKNVANLHELIKKGDFTVPEFEDGTTVSPDVQRLIRQMIKLDPEKRLTIPQILVSKWLKDLNSSDDEDSEEEEKVKEEGDKCKTYQIGDDQKLTSDEMKAQTMRQGQDRPKLEVK